MIPTLTPPAAPVITGCTPDTGVQGDHSTAARSVAISGTSEPGVARVVVHDPERASTDFLV